MADNVAITAGTGTTIGADEVTDGTLGTVKVQYVKLMDGTLDGTSKATVGANGLKVDGSAVTQPVSGTVTANAGTGSFTVAQATASNLKVDLSGTAANATAIKVDGSAVTQPVSGTITSNAGTGTRDTNLKQVNGTIVDTNSGNKSAGTQRMVLATDQPNLATPLNIFNQPNSTDNSLVSSKTVCAASTNATSVKASAGKVYRVDAFNSDTVGYWVKFYNKASAPTVGTDVPVATKFVPAGGGFVIESSTGIPYTTGIALATTLNATDADTTVVTNANKLVINLRYV